MGPHEPDEQAQPLVSPEVEMLWRTLMDRFEDASQEVLAALHAHETQATQKDLDALIRAQLRRSRAIHDMLHFLDSLDEIGKRSR
jgi:hypothetical protein